MDDSGTVIWDKPCHNPDAETCEDCPFEEWCEV